MDASMIPNPKDALLYAGIVIGVLYLISELAN